MQKALDEFAEGSQRGEGDYRWSNAEKGKSLAGTALTKIQVAVLSILVKSNREQEN